MIILGIILVVLGLILPSLIPAFAFAHEVSRSALTPDAPDELPPNRLKAMLELIELTKTRSEPPV